eukprot:7334459-Lingulodinium_polyedra.AAC.1
MVGRAASTRPTSSSAPSPRRCWGWSWSRRAPKIRPLGPASPTRPAPGRSRASSGTWTSASGQRRPGTRRRRRRSLRASASEPRRPTTRPLRAMSWWASVAGT